MMGPTDLGYPDGTERTVEIVPGAALRCWDSGGRGAAVIFAHPHTGNHLSWGAQAAAFAAHGFRVIAFSRRGYLGSTPLLDAGEATQADDVAALLDRLDIAAAHFVGVAAGGATVLDVALSHPGRTLSVAAASSLMGFDDPDFRSRLTVLKESWFRALPHEARELGASFRAFCPQEVERWRGIFAMNPPLAAPKEGRMLQQPLRSEIDYEGLNRYGGPILLATGAADPYMPPRLLRHVAERVPDAQVHVFEQAAHAPHVETSDEFNRVIGGFIARIP
ncbi:alpha/beta fold hydrolase [Frigidibacter mobilis]|uniref:YtxM n=1 Tax=Frigidibacter mobilis TaxID=1335048 RepID=A0A159Z6Q4_9RHOB|nr:alpha/beta fold hydrolase [Frigidibacter mobilis]AMY71047.1 YtxM [Frigidibacter mobilis]